MLDDENIHPSLGEILLKVVRNEPLTFQEGFRYIAHVSKLPTSQAEEFLDKFHRQYCGATEYDDDKSK